MPFDKSRSASLLLQSVIQIPIFLKSVNKYPDFS